MITQDQLTEYNRLTGSSLQLGNLTLGQSLSLDQWVVGRRVALEQEARMAQGLKAQEYAMTATGLVNKETGVKESWAHNLTGVSSEILAQAQGQPATSFLPSLPHPDASNQTIGPNLGGQDAVYDQPGTTATASGGTGGSSGAGGMLILLGGGLLLALVLMRRK